MAIITPSPGASVTPAKDEVEPNVNETDLSKEYDTPLGIAHGTYEALKDRIKLHYNLASDYYLSLWGEHIHHGYWPPNTTPEPTKEEAQNNLIRLLLKQSSLTPSTETKILDVGCGIGGTTRYLATTFGAKITGITISSRQVELATQLTSRDSSLPPTKDGFLPVGGKGGKVRFLDQDAEKLSERFGGGEFDVVWLIESLSHMAHKQTFFRNAFEVLGRGGTLVLADWFRDEGVGEHGDIKAIEDGMLLPPLCTQLDYVQFAKDAGFEVLAEPLDISQEVKKTWDLSWSLVQKPSLWAFALSQGRDGIAFLQSFRAMRRGYANGTFRYAVVAFRKV